MIYLNLDPTYFSNIKTIRLVALLGPNMDVLPLRLWAHCGMHHAETGSLPGYTVREIEHIVGWTGKRGKAVEAMTKVGFLDSFEGEYRVHDWLEHEGHISALKNRSKKANEARWGRIREGDSPKREATGFLTTSLGSSSPGVEAGIPGVEGESSAVETSCPGVEKESYGAGMGSRGFDKGTHTFETRTPRVETRSPKVEPWTPRIETRSPLSIPSIPFYPEKKKQQQQQQMLDLAPEDLKGKTGEPEDPSATTVQPGVAPADLKGRSVKSPDAAPAGNISRIQVISKSKIVQLAVLPENPPRTAVLLKAPATADTVTMHTPPVPATPGNDLEQIIYDRVGRRKRLSRGDMEKVLELKRKHGEEFYSACERLHTGVDIVPAYLRAILEPKDKAAEQAERFKELVEKSGIRWAN